MKGGRIMALGRESVQIHTENPIKVDEELKEEQKERKKEVLSIIADIIYRIIKSRL